MIIESFRYLVDEKRVKIFAFVKGKLLVTPKFAGVVIRGSFVKIANFWEHRTTAKGKAPKSIKRLDKGSPQHKEEPHIHFKDKSALYKSGKWKHGERKLTNEEKKYLEKIGWKFPKD